MPAELAATSNRHGGWRAVSRAALVAVLAALGVLVAGCGSGSPGAQVAQVQTTATTTTTSTPPSSKASPAAYSACMRKNGVPTFPDPDSQGRLTLRAGPGTGINPESAQFKRAEQACRKLQPGGGRAPSAQEQRKALQTMLKFSACMRSHGVPKFPDPKIASGGGSGLSIGRSSGIDPNSPQFQAAQRACQKLMPGAGPGTAGPGAGKRTSSGAN
jgi:hypothetical protein